MRISLAWLFVDVVCTAKTATLFTNFCFESPKGKMKFSAPSLAVAILSVMAVARVVALEEAIVDASSALDARRLKEKAVLPSLDDTTGAPPRALFP